MTYLYGFLEYSHLFANPILYQSQKNSSMTHHVFCFQFQEFWILRWSMPRQRYRISGYPISVWTCMINLWWWGPFCPYGLELPNFDRRMRRGTIWQATFDQIDGVFDTKRSKTWINAYTMHRCLSWVRQAQGNDRSKFCQPRKRHIEET